MFRNILLLFVLLFCMTQLALAQITAEKLMTVIGENANDYFGYSVSSAGDVNGDGINDVIIGAYGMGAGGSGAGRAYVFFGAASFYGSLDASQADVILTGENANDYFGSSVSSAGDVNGDGINDVIIGAGINDAGGSGAGRAYVFFGASSFYGSLDASQADVILTGENSDDHFGYSVSSAGDVNGDGINDVIIGADRNDYGGSKAGRAYVFFGAAFFSGSLDASQADVILTGENANDYFGSSVSSAGDVNGDGINDVIIGASLAGDLGDGRAYVFFGAASFSGSLDASQADVILTSENSNDHFGCSVSSAGDVNGDGINDVIIGAVNNDAGGSAAGRAYVFFGAASFSGSLDASQADMILTGENADDRFGYSVSSAGDVNGDGINDVIIGADRNDYGGSMAGASYIYKYMYNMYGLNISCPNGGEAWKGGDIKSISWYTIELRSVDHIKLFYSTDGGASYPFLIANNVPDSGSFYWTVPAINSNTIRVKCQAISAANTVLAENASRANFTIDSTPPNTFNLQSPSNGIWTSDMPAFSYQATTDNFGMLKYQLWVDGVVNQDSVPTTITSTPPKAPLAGGFHTWNIKAIDKAGNARLSNQTWSVRVDSEPPSLFNLLAPADSTWSKYGMETFLWTPSSDAGSGLEKYVFHFGVATNELSNNQTSYVPGSVNSGSYEWYVEVVDAVGNITESNERRTIFIDNTPPLYFNIVSPADNIWTKNTTPIFSWQASSDAHSGLSKYELYINNNKIIDNIDPGATSVEIDSSLQLSEGNHTWYVRAVDMLGNTQTSNQTYTLKIDLTPPNAFSLKAPYDSSFANFPTPDFSWYATSDNRSGFSHYSLWIDDVMSVDNITSTTSSPGSPINEGPHIWYVKAVDNVGNIQESNEIWTIFGEWNPPESFNLISPEDGAVLNTDMPIFVWDATTDLGSGVDRYQLWIDGILSDSCSAIDTSIISPNPLSNGDHYWFIKAIDRAGNERVSNATWQFTLDRSGNLAPVISQVSDLSATEDETFSYQITATDPNTSDVLRFQDNTSLFDIDRFTGKFEFTPTNEDVGIHEITVTVTDGDLSDSTKFNLTVENVNDAPSTFELLYPAHFAIIETLNPNLVWTRSNDIDLGDTIKYKISVDTLSTFATPIVFSDVLDTNFVIPYGLKKSKDYFWKVEAFDLSGATTECASFHKFTTSDNATYVGYDKRGNIINDYVLFQNHPNPFNPETHISFQIPKPTHVTIKIFNQLGQEIKVLLDKEMTSGFHDVLWNGKAKLGNKIGSGIYLYQIKAGEFVDVKKMILMQ